MVLWIGEPCRSVKVPSSRGLPLWFDNEKNTVPGPGALKRMTRRATPSAATPSRLRPWVASVWLVGSDITCELERSVVASRRSTVPACPTDGVRWYEPFHSTSQQLPALSTGFGWNGQFASEVA